MSSMDEEVARENQKKRKEVERDEKDDRDTKKTKLVENPPSDETHTIPSEYHPTNSNTSTNEEVGYRSIGTSKGEIEDSSDRNESFFSLLSSLVHFFHALDQLALDDSEYHTVTESGNARITFGKIVKECFAASTRLHRILVDLIRLFLDSKISGSSSIRQERRRDAMVRLKSEVFKEGILKLDIPELHVANSPEIYESTVSHLVTALQELKKAVGEEEWKKLKEGPIPSTAGVSPADQILKLEVDGQGRLFSAMNGVEAEKCMEQHFHQFEALSAFLEAIETHYRNFANSLFKFKVNDREVEKWCDVTLSGAKILRFSFRSNALLSQMLIQLSIKSKAQKMTSSCPSEIATTTRELTGSVSSSTDVTPSDWLEGFAERYEEEAFQMMTSSAMKSYSQLGMAKEVSDLALLQPSLKYLVTLCLSSKGQLNIDSKRMREYKEALTKGALAHPDRVSIDRPLDRDRMGATPVNAIELLEGAIVSLVKERKVDFPWKRCNNHLDVNVLFNTLKQWHYNGAATRVVRQEVRVPGLQEKAKGFFPHTFQETVDSKPSYFSFYSEPEDYETMEIITDYFQEKARMEGRVKSEKYSPLEYWDAKAADLLLDTLKQSGDRQLLAREARELVYDRVKECTQFKVTVVKGVLDLLQAHRYLDISAGWGDRLIGALATASIERYVGVDPNDRLQPGYLDIIHSLEPNPSRQARFTVLPQPFQTATLPPGETFDLVFTSPPYFDFEIYSSANTQSIATHASFNRWLIEFLFVSIQKAWSVLDDLGHLAIHITDTRDMKVCEVMNLFIQSRLPHSLYLGIIGSIGKRKDIARPIWVWRKDAHALALSPSLSKRKFDANALLKDHYSHHYANIEKIAPFSP